MTDNRREGGDNSYQVYNCSGPGNLEGDCEQTPLYLGAYDKNNVLPYTSIHLNLQWQPRNDLAVTIGYTGNRGRHAVIPILSTSRRPLRHQSRDDSGATPHSSGETSSYAMTY